MTQPRFEVVADRDRGDNPRPQDIRDGDRYVLDAPYLGDTQIIRIERPASDYGLDAGHYEYRVVDLEDPVTTASSNIPDYSTAKYVLDRDRRQHPQPERLVLDRRWVGAWERDERGAAAGDGLRAEG